jgi:hypothetical protein
MGKKLNWICFAVVTIGQCAFAFAGNANRNAALWRPRFATPAIVSLATPADRQFTAEIKASATAKNWSLSISNDLREWPCQVISGKYSRINRGTEPGWQIKASIPAETPPELFTLVAACNELTAVQGQSVSVAPNFTDDFYILHLSDEQIVNEKHTNPSGQFYGSVGTAEEMKWMQEPINLLNPRFVIITGDQVDYNGALDGWNNWHNWGYEPGQHRRFTEKETTDIQMRLIGMYKDSHLGYRVPYVEAPGNHDVPPTDKLLLGSTRKWHPIAVPIYESEFGQRSWSFRMGDIYVLLHDWTERSLQTWAAQDYAKSLNDPTIKFRIVGQHFNTDKAFIPQTCDLMLVGHGHTTATLQSAPYYIYEDGPTFKYGTGGFFNFRRNGSGWTCDQTTAPRDVKKDVWKLFGDHGTPRAVRSNRTDSMNISENSITITNSLPQTFYDGRVRFLLPKGKYAATNGKILAQYDCQQATKTAVLVKVPIPATSSTTITISPATDPVKTASLEK